MTKRQRKQLAKKATKRARRPGAVSVRPKPAKGSAQAKRRTRKGNDPDFDLDELEAAVMALRADADSASLEELEAASEVMSLTPDVLPDDPALGHEGCAPKNFRANCAGFDARWQTPNS